MKNRRITADSLYASPIELHIGEPRYETTVNELFNAVDKFVLKAVQEVGIKVDKEELEKALRYDRYQFHAGYTNGYNEGYHQGYDDGYEDGEPKHGYWI